MALMFARKYRRTHRSIVKKADKLKRRLESSDNELSTRLIGSFTGLINEASRLSIWVSIHRNLLELRQIPITEQLDLWLAIAENLRELRNPTEALQAAYTAYIVGKDLHDPISKQRTKEALHTCRQLEKEISTD